MSENPPPRDDAPLADTLARLNERLSRVEQYLGLPPLESEGAPTEARAAPVPPGPRDEFETMVGQNWFAGVGIAVLTCGVAFALSLPLSGLPAAVPALIGYALTGGLFLAAHFWHRSFELVARCFRGAAIVLLYFSTLRLFFFGTMPVLAIASGWSRTALVAAVAFNLVVAWRNRSRTLMVFALLTGYVTTIVAEAPWWLFVGTAILAGLIAGLARRRGAFGLLFLGIAGGYLTYLYWMMGRPWAGHPAHLATAPAVGVTFLLLLAAVNGLAPLWRSDGAAENQLTILAAIFNCFLGYGIFLAHTALAFRPVFAVMHLVAALVFLGLAAVFWRQGENHVSTFFYAMTGYVALSAAILKASAAPDVFIWLSLQSLVVVATALWFRSRFIVVANFLIFVLVVAGYMFTVSRETGISIGFGVVALVTARVLNWKRERLALRTDLMRNAYLTCAFIVFPYALYHLVPRAYVSVSWVGVALGYYAMHIAVHNVKYRWMGHLTLLLTVIYVLAVGLRDLPPAHRILTFLVLGMAFLVVSLVYSRRRRRRPDGSPSEETPKKAP